MANSDVVQEYQINDLTDAVKKHTVAKDALPTFIASGDATSSVQSFINTPASSSTRRIVGTFTIAGTITVPDGITLDLTDAAITQTTAHVTTISVGANCEVIGGTLYGLGTDYVPFQSGGNGVDSIGIKITGADSTVTGTRLIGFASAAIMVVAAARSVVRNVNIVGVDGYKGQTIAKQDAACNGVYYSGTCPDATIQGFSVRSVSIGVIASLNCTDMTVSDGRLYDIKGQHGMYLQDGNGLNITGVTGRNVQMNLIKVQLYDAATDSRSLSISNVSGRDVGLSGTDGSVVCLINTSTALSTSAKMYGASVANVSGVDCYRVLYVKSVRGGSFTNVSAIRTTLEPVTIFDVQDAVFEGVSINTCTRNGIVFLAGSGGATQRVTVRGVRMHNAATAATASNRYGIFIACAADNIDGRDITIDGVDISSTTNTMDYGIFMQSGHQETLRVRNVNITGNTSGLPSIRLISATRDVAEWVNVRTGGVAPQNFPAARVTYAGTFGSAQVYSINSATPPTYGVYSTGDRVERTVVAAAASPGWICTTAGGAYSSTWAASTAYTLGAWVRTSNGYVYEVTTAGTSGATEPVAPASKGDTVTDGTVVWTYRYQASAVFKAMANVAA